MAKSKVFAGIKRDTLLITSAIPCGRVTTYASIGRYLSVMPRHIAYILSTLTEEEQQTTPWYRVVGESGKLGKPKFGFFGRSQPDFLQDESVITTKDAVLDFEGRFIDAFVLSNGIEPHKLYQQE